jgi:hypothetical protein
VTLSALNDRKRLRKEAVDRGHAELEALPVEGVLDRPPKELVGSLVVVVVVDRVAVANFRLHSLEVSFMSCDLERSLGVTVRLSLQTASRSCDL